MHRQIVTSALTRQIASHIMFRRSPVGGFFSKATASNELRHFVSAVRTATRWSIFGTAGIIHTSFWGSTSPEMASEFEIQVRKWTRGRTSMIFALYVYGIELDEAQ